MARPLVLVYQDIQQASVEPAVPDLHSVIVGPAYVIKDYPDDAATILLSGKYGQLEQPAGGASAYLPPVANTAAVTVVSYPGNEAGSLVDHSSVRIFLQNPRVILGSTNPSVTPVLGTAITTSSTLGLENKVLFTGTGTDLVTAGVKVGDRLILTDSSGVSTTGTVASVGEPDAAGAVTDNRSLRLAANLPSTGWIFDNAGEVRVERQLVTQEFVDTTGNFITFPFAGTDTLVLNGGMTLGGLTVSYAGVYLSYRALRQDLASDVDFVTSNDILVDSAGRSYFAKLGLVDARNPLAAGLMVALANAGAAPVYYLGVQSNDVAGHAAARAVTESRTDLWAFVPLTDNLSVTASYALEWNQLADPNYALENGVPQKFRGVLGSTTLPVNSVISPSSVTGVAAQPATATNTNLYRTLQLTGTPAMDVSSVVAGDLVTIGLAPTSGTWQTRRGTHTVARVNKSADVPTVGSNPEIELLPSSSRWNDTAGDSSTGLEVVITSPTGVTKLSKLASRQIDDGSGNGVKFQMIVPTVIGGPYRIGYASGAALGVSIVGYDITITVVTASTTYDNVVAFVNAHATLKQLLVASRVGTNAAISAAVALAAVSVSSTLCAGVIAKNDDLFVWLYDASAKFLTNGVKVGDVVQLPVYPNDYTPNALSGVVLSYKVAQVISENRLQVAVLGDDSPSSANELPHYYDRLVGGRYLDNETTTSSASLRYQIVRSLTSDEQVNQLISVAQSLRTKRATVVWPDLVDVDGLKDGSKPRTNPQVPALASSQPGWYIACQVAGALAGLPVQHGLTGLGLAGVKKLYHSTKFFREAQLTKLSDGGLFVMHQNTPAALPECIHQLTTDPTANETGELSVVRNIDYVSITFHDVVRPFLGQWNVLPETLSAMFSALQVAISDLKGRKLARVGAPLTSAEITSLKVSDVAANRVVSYISPKVPGPLNNVDLHLVF